MSKKPYWKRNLIAIDQLANVLFSPLLNRYLPINALAFFGYEDETLSSVFAKNACYVSWCGFMCRVLHVFDQGHCEASLEKDEGDTKQQ